MNSANTSDLNHMLFEQVRKFIETGAEDLSSLEGSDALLWVEHEDMDFDNSDAILDEVQGMLDDINAVLVPGDAIGYDFLEDDFPREVVPLQFDGREEVFSFTVDGPDETYSIELGYLQVLVETVQQLISPLYELRWWKGFEYENFDPSSRPLVILTSEQWQVLERDIGCARLNTLFEPVRSATGSGRGMSF